MLLLHFQLGPHRYALDTRHIVEVVPLLTCQPLPHAPRGVAGLIHYRGRRLPALDLCQLTLGRPAVEQLSTRILIVQHPKSGRHAAPGGQSPSRAESGIAGEVQLLGLIVERAAGTLRRVAEECMTAAAEQVGAAFLGPVLLDDQGAIQLLDPQKLFEAGGPPLRLAPSVEVSDAPD